MQIDEILQYVQGKEFENVSRDLLEKFSNLRLSNYEEFLTDARARSEAQSERNRQINSLLSRMKNDLAK